MKGLIALMAAVAAAYMERSVIAHIVPFLQKDGDYSTEEISIMLAAFGVGYVVGLPFSGAIIDKFGYKRTLIATMFGWAFSGLLFATASGINTLILARFLLGLAEAPLFPLFVAWITQSSPYKTRTLWIGVVEMFSYVGMALSGPIAVYFATILNWRFSYGVVSAVALASAALVAGMLREPPPPENGAAAPLKLTAILKDPNVVAIAFAFMLYNFGKSFYSTWMPSLLISQYGKTSWEAANISSMQSIIAPAASVLAAGVATVLIRRRWKSASSKIMPMSVGFSLGFVIALVAGSPHLVTYLTIVSFVGLISTSSLIWGTVSDVVDRRSVVHAGGVINAIANIGTIFSPLLVGYYVQSFPVYATVPVGIASLASLALFLIAYRRSVR